MTTLLRNQPYSLAEWRQFLNAKQHLIAPCSKRDDDEIHSKRPNLHF